MDKNDKIFVAGHKGLVGSAIVRKLNEKGFKNIVVRDRKELNLLNQIDVRNFFEKENIDCVFLAAAKVGGILANSEYPGEFIFENLEIQNNVIKSAHDFKVKKLLFLGSTCIYPKECPQPIKEEYLLSGYLEKTNEAYAIAKIAGLEMCKFFKKQYGDNFISCMPTNLYGINDNFDLKNSHVLPALIRRFREAKINNLNEVVIWGTGKPLREFMYVDDMAEACIFLIEKYNGDNHINVGTGKEISIKDLAFLIKDIVGFKGEIVFDETKPDGTMRKVTDISKLNALGFEAKTSLRDGIEITYKWFCENIEGYRS